MPRRSGNLVLVLSDWSIYGHQADTIGSQVWLWLPAVVLTVGCVLMRWLIKTPPPKLPTAMQAAIDAYDPAADSDSSSGFDGMGSLGDRSSWSGDETPASSPDVSSDGEFVDNVIAEVHRRYGPPSA